MSYQERSDRARLLEHCEQMRRATQSLLTKTRTSLEEIYERVDATRRRVEESRLLLDASVKAKP